MSSAQTNRDWHGGMLAEGYSSSAPDRVAELHYRAFTTTSQIGSALDELPCTLRVFSEQNRDQNEGGWPKIAANELLEAA